MSSVPVEQSERLHALDILRGFALYGMILVHFHQKMRIEMPGFEDLIGWGVWMLVEQKAWGTFALLFGAGFAILLRRLEARGVPTGAIYFRRMVALAGFGIAAELLTGFTILFEYACWGAVLYFLRKLPTRALIAIAVFAVCARPMLGAWYAVVAAHAGLTLPMPPRVALTRAVEAAAAGRDYGALFAARWALFVGTLPHRWRDLLPDSNLALFITGLLAVRYRVFDEPRRHVRTIVGWMAGGLAAWCGWWFVLRPLLPEPTRTVDVALAALIGVSADQWLCFTYVGALLLLLAYRPVWMSRLAFVGAAGRMALTNYLLQATVLDVLSSGYGFGLKLRPFVYVPASFVLFGTVAATSVAWLRRFRFGPAEWLWRSITYARWQPFRARLTPRAFDSGTATG